LIDWDFHQNFEFYLLTEEEGAWILPLLFVIPFVCCKVIEYIVDGFKQEEKLHEKYYFYYWNESVGEMRLVTSWDTTEEDVDGLIEYLKTL
jgi:hypothetical protein